MPDLAMDEHGGEPQSVSRRAFLSTGAAGISAAALVPGAPDAAAQTGAQTDRPGKDAAMSLSREFAAFVATCAMRTCRPMWLIGLRASLSKRLPRRWWAETCWPAARRWR